MKSKEEEEVRRRLNASVGEVHNFKYKKQPPSKKYHMTMSNLGEEGKNHVFRMGNCTADMFTLFISVLPC